MTIFEVGPALEAIYNAEIPIRLEWAYDSGYTWVLIRDDPGSHPRTWIDDSLSGITQGITQSDAGAKAADKGQFLQVDWMDRGCDIKLEVAIQQLLDAIKTYYPKFEL